MAQMTESDINVENITGAGTVKNVEQSAYRVDENSAQWIHTDKIYNQLINAAAIMESRLQESLKNYEDHPDVQANLQQLQYDLQSWNLALTTMTNIQKNMADALSAIANNFK